MSIVTVLRNVSCSCLAGALFATCLTPLSAQLKAGAARVDITPSAADLTAQFTSISAPLFARALVLDDLGKRVVIVVADVPNISTSILDELTRRIAATAGVPTANVLVAVTHTHSSYRIDVNPAGGVLPQSEKVTVMTEARMIDSVRQAIKNLQPARAGYATDVFSLATDSPGATSAVATGTQEAAMTTLGVFKVEAQAGGMIAVLINGGPEPILGMSSKTRVNGDVAGVTERFVEQHFNDKAVAIYTIGALPSKILNLRRLPPEASSTDVDNMVGSVGARLGGEALNVLARIKTTSNVPLSGAAQVLTCPGKVTTPLNNPASCSNAPNAKLPACVFTDHDAPPVNLRIGVLHLGALAIVDADSNINSEVWAEVAAHAPSPAETMLVALTYGPMHYVQQDAEYPSNSYPITATTARRGCAEKGFVDDALGMLRSVEADPTK